MLEEVHYCLVVLVDSNIFCDVSLLSTELTVVNFCASLSVMFIRLLPGGGGRETRLLLLWDDCCDSELLPAKNLSIEKAVICSLKSSSF